MLVELDFIGDLFVSEVAGFFLMFTLLFSLKIKS